MIRRFADSGEEWVRALRRRHQTVSWGSELNRCGTRRAGNSRETTTRLRCLRFEQLHHPGAMPVHTNGIPHGVGWTELGVSRERNVRPQVCSLTVQELTSRSWGTFL